MILKGIIAL